jgi:hypothetical protein
MEFLELGASSKLSTFNAPGTYTVYVKDKMVVYRQEQPNSCISTTAAAAVSKKH